MKIAFFHNLPSGGAKRVYYEQVKGLSRRHNIDIYRLSCTDESFLSADIFSHNVYTYHYTSNPVFPKPFRRLYQDLQQLFLLDRLHRQIAGDINSRKYDVVILHPDRFSQAPFLLKYLHIPTIYYCHELLRIGYEKELINTKHLPTINKIHDFIIRKVMVRNDVMNARSASCILANSQYTMSSIKRVYHQKAVICHCGVDSRVFHPFNYLPKNQVLFIGEPVNINGFNLVCDLHLKNLKIINPKNNQLISDTELAKEYSQSIFTLCTSINEPFGLVPIESMACGTPVIAVNQGGYKETIVDKITGYLLPRDRIIFKKYSQFLINNPQEAVKMGEAGRRHVLENFTWTKHLRIIEDEIDKLCQYD